MQNKFKKATEQRYKEDEKLEIKQNNDTTENLKNSDIVKTDNEDEATNTTKLVTNEDTNSFLDNIIKVPENKEFTNKTYYLEKTVSDKISQIAKTKKISDSKLLNEILKHVLR